jgi:hypothetical protein
MTGTATIQVGQFGRPILSKDGRTITVHIPITMRHQGGRKQVVTPGRGYSMDSRFDPRRQHPGEGDRPRPSLARHAGVRRLRYGP